MQLRVLEYELDSHTNSIPSLKIYIYAHVIYFKHAHFILFRKETGWKFFLRKKWLAITEHYRVSATGAVINW